MSKTLVFRLEIDLDPGCDQDGCAVAAALRRVADAVNGERLAQTNAWGVRHIAHPHHLTQSILDSNGHRIGSYVVKEVEGYV